jgi:predicted permease
MGIWARIRKTLHGGRHSAEIQEELEFHLQMDIADGHDRRDARLRLGNLTRIEEDTRAMGIVEWLDSALQDARYGLRQLRKSPALAMAVVLSVAVGVGANAAIFSLIDAALLKPLPVRDPGSLRILEWTHDGFPPGVENINGTFRPIAGNRSQGSSIAAYLYRRLAKEQAGFEVLIGMGASPEGAAIAVDSLPAEQVSLQYVSSNFFQGLGAAPAIGRPFQEDEDRVGAEPVVIVSYRFWQQRLADSGAVTDRNVRINNVPARIVGVAPPGFFGLRAGQWPDVYAPLAMRVAFQPPPANGAPRGEKDRDWWVRQIARLKPGVSEAAALAQLQSLLKTPELISLPGRRGLDALNTSDAKALWILMLLVCVLLLIVCANVANLLLSRSVGRRRESSVRLALGAPRSRLFRQHLIESGVLATLGGGAGLGLGYVLAHSIHLLFQTGRDASNAFDLHLDPRVLIYTAAITVATAFLFGLAPALRAARASIDEALKAQTRSVMGGGLRLPRILVSMQIALCLSALVAAALLGRSLEKLKWTDAGFDRQNLAYVSVAPAMAGYPIEREGPYVDRVREALASLPGVSQVSTVQTRLLSGSGNNSRVNLPGREWSDNYRANLNAVGDSFFETMRIPLVAGRTFDRRDMSPNSKAMVVDELFARRYFPNQNPLGLRLGLNPKDSQQYEIVGVVGNSRYNSLRSDAYPTVYTPYRPGATMHFVMRTTADPATLAEAARRAVASIDPAVPLTEFHTQSALIDRLLRTERLLGFVSGVFGMVGLALAAIGLGGLLAYGVARRTSEIGLRMALGAAGGDVVRMVLRDSLWMLGVGIVAGLPCAYAVSRFLRTSLFQLDPLDPASTALALGGLTAVALLAASLPARRAARIDPLAALREE